MDASPTIPIESGVPLPRVKRNPPPKQEKYPWSRMQPGDSFFVPGGRQTSADKRPGVVVTVAHNSAEKRFPGTKWATRQVTENGINGVRVWRVS